MSLETGNYIGDLVVTNPPPGDPKSQGDDHLRLLKNALRNGFPGFTGSIMIGGIDTGVADAYVLAPLTALLAYLANTMVVWKPSATNTLTAPTMNISGLGTRTIKAVNGAPLQPGDLVAGQYAVMIDTGADYRLVAVTKNYVDNLAFTSALPTPPAGNGPFILIYENGVFSYTESLFPSYLIQAQGVV